MIINDIVYGQQKIKDKLVIDLIHSPEMQRLKGINQYGTLGLWDQKYNTTRFEHSVGVYFLLRRFNASYHEQIAGLLHDINHTAFSHVIDYLLGNPQLQEHGDKNHENILRNSSIPKLLERHNIKIGELLEKDKFSLLEKPLPDLCCDRIDYCLRDSLLYGTSTSEDINLLLDSFIVYNKEIIVKNKKNALKLASVYLNTSRELWVNHIQSGIFQLSADAFKMGLQKGIIAEKDFYLTDSMLLNKLIQANESEIIEKFTVIRNHGVKKGSKDDYDFIAYGKARYIDPKFIENNKIKRVSGIDEGFRKAINEFKEKVSRGFYIKISK